MRAVQTWARQGAYGSSLSVATATPPLRLGSLPCARTGREMIQKKKIENEIELKALVMS